MPIVLHDIVRGRLPQGGYRFAFLHPYQPAFLYACRALEIRGLLKWGMAPIAIPGLAPQPAWYADIPVLDQTSYAWYAMLVRGYFKGEAQQKFNEVFPFATSSVEALVNDPANYLKAQQPVIDRLVAKYKDTQAPLMFYGKPFSAEGVALFLDSLKAKDGRRGCICNSEQGLGKTRQGTVAATEAGFKRVLLIAPKTARISAWPTELNLLGLENQYTLIDDTNWEGSKTRWDLLQWDRLRMMPDSFFARCQYEVIEADEFHFASSEESARSQALERLMTRIQWLWGLTGTAVKKRPSDVLNLLKLIRHPIAVTDGRPDPDKATAFLVRYCGSWDKKTNLWKPKPANLPELHHILCDSLFRREKAETDLPPQVYVPVEVTFTEAEMAEVEKAWDDYLNDPPKKAMMHSPKFDYAKVRMGVLQRAAALVMTRYTIDFAQDFLDSGEKVILFTASTPVIDIFKERFGKRAVTVDGRTSQEKRAEAEKRFQTDPKIDVFNGNVQAAGVSLTLTKSHISLFNDTTWLVSDTEQAAARNNRGGSIQDGYSYFFYAVDTPLHSVFKDFVKNLMVVDQITRLRDKAGKLIKKTTWAPTMYLKGGK